MQRRLAAILAADVVGYSRLMGADEVGTLAELKRHRDDIIDPKASQYHGRVVKLMGDGILMEFGSVVDAVQFAVDVQIAMGERNADIPEDSQVVYRIGINLGDIVHQEGDIYGDGVNVAARLEGLAEPGGICISRSARDQIRDKLDLTLDDQGEIEVKNIARPVRVFRLLIDDKAHSLATPVLAPTTAEGPNRLPIYFAAAIAIVLAAGIAWWQLSRPEFEPVGPAEMAEVLPDKPSMAVLALDDLSSGQDQDYLSDAIAEGIITELSRFSEFFVIARNSSFKYRDKATDVRTIARELGVHYVVEGSQQKNGDQLRVTVQLIDALAGNHIWAETYDRDLADLFAVQGEIVREIAAAVGAKVAFRPPPSGGLAAVSALHLNLKGRPFVRQWNREGTLKALKLNLAAVEADPNAPYGYIGLAFLYPRAEYGWLEMDGASGLAKAEEAAEKALALDPDNYDTHFARAFVHSQRGGQDLAIKRYQRALELNPNAANVMGSLAEAKMYKGRVDEALELMQKAVRLDPHHPDWFKWNLAWAQWGKGDCESALATMQAMTNMPNRAHRMLAVIHVCLGQQEEAEAALKKFLEKNPDYSVTAMRKVADKRYTDKALLDRYVDGLRQAGLAE